jgi:polar amino acid transport system permease protein
MRSIALNDIWIIVSALRWTVFLSLTVFLIGSIVGLIIAVCRTSSFFWLRIPAILYIQIVQSTPLLGILFMFFFGMPLMLGVEVSSFMAATMAFSMSAAAFLGEIWRGAIQAIPQTQWEASASLGITRWHQMRHVVWPQAIRIATPPTIGYAVQLIKNTSLSALVGFIELTRAGQIVSGSTLKPLIVFAIVATLYFALCYPLARLSLSLEDKLNVYRAH